MKKSNLPLIDIKDCYCYQDIVKKLKLPVNGTSTRKVKNYIIENNLNIEHFDKNKKNRKHLILNKTCPVCNKEFKTSSNKESITCSYSCSNTHFRSGANNPNYKEDKNNYRAICFKYHKKECIVCKENLIVAVHHFDENHENNNIDNLIPLCPTHHTYMHSKHKHLITDVVEKYIKDFNTKCSTKPTSAIPCL